MKTTISFLVIILFVTFGCDQNKMPVEIQDTGQTNINSFSKTSNVPDDFATIQDAVEAAEPGDVIVIKQGVYQELILIQGKSDITIIGENAILSPPDGIVNGEGIFNIEILECSNIVINNLKFDGKINEERIYPIDRAITFNSSSGEVSKCNFEGYGLAIATFNVPPAPDPNPFLMSINILDNKFVDCFGQMEISGNYNYRVDHNIISYSFMQSRSFDNYFPHWCGVLIEGGTGTISKNKIKFKQGSEYLISSTGIRLMKRDPAAHLAGLMNDLYDVDVVQNMINGTGIGIMVNSNEEFYDEFGQVLEEDWCVHGVSLLNNNFVQVSVQYEIYNECEQVEIEP